MKKKNLSKLVALAVLLGSMSCMQSVWADPIPDPDDIVISSSGVVPTDYGGGSDTTYIWGAGGNRTVGQDVVNSIKTSGDVALTVYGIKVGNTDSFKVDSLSGGIDVKSTNDSAYGIYLDSTGTNTISGLGNITANTTASNTSLGAYGIYSHASGESNFSFVTSGGTIKTTSTTGSSYGTFAYEGKVKVLNIKGIEVTGVNTAGISGSQDSESEYSFIATGGDIKVTSSSKSASMGITAKNDSKITVTNLKSITVEKNNTEAGNVFGIYSTNNAENNVSFVTSGGTIKATTIGGIAYGVYAIFTSKSTVENLGSITVKTTAIDKNAYGIYSKGSAENNVSFVTSGGTIKATAAGGNAYGIFFGPSDKDSSAIGTTTVKNLGSITAENTGTGIAYGIYSNGTADTFTNNVSFKGNGGQAITATNTITPANAYSIYAEGKGATTVNFESSILSGKIKQDGDATLTLNFNNGGVWTVKSDDMTGNVNVNVNAGGTIDTRATTTETKTINLGTGTFTALPKDEGDTTIYPLISFDAWAKSDNTLVTDQVTAASTSGTIKLGTVNVMDEATEAWTTAKEVNLFSATTNNITITGKEETQTSQGWLYTFEGGANGKVSVKSECAPHTLPEIIQGSDVAAKKVNAYSLTANEALAKDLGTLDNSQRTSGLTIYGNNKTISKGTATNGTVTLAQTTDILTVKDVTVSGFTKFADNAGTLNLSGVTFTGTTGADVITGTGKTVISGVVTADKNIAQQVELQNGANLTATGISVDSTGEAKGIYVNMTNASDTASSSVGSITAKSSGKDANGIYLDGTGTTTISGLGSITAETTGEAPASAYGIYAKDGENTVQFTEDGGSVFAKSTSTGAVGIKTDDGTNNISNLKSVSVVTSANTGTMSVAGVYLCAGTNTITFTGANSSITATATGTTADAYGIDSDEDGTNIISNLGSITVETAGSGKSAYGIHMYGVDGANTISFKGNGGQAITATNTANSANAYSIYAKGGTGTTTVNFENSILSGKVHQEGTATLNLNFNDKGTWRPKADDVTGTVAVTVNNGGSIDTRTYDAQGKVAAAAVKTVDLKDCTLTFADGAKINADAVVTNDGLTMDNFTVKAASGTFSLADLNINDSAVTTAWTGVKEVDLLTGDCTNITFSQSVVESTNYAYTFTLGSASAQKLTLNVAIQEIGLPNVVSGGSDKTSYKLKKDEEVLKKDLGTLDNSNRESFTIEGDGKTLVANGYKGVTITKDTDKMYVNNITIKGFDTFATVEAGELILKDVSFTDSGTADVVNNSAHTVIIDGTVTLDKGITGEGRVVQKEGSTLEVDVTKVLTNAMIRDIDNASQLDVKQGTLHLTCEDGDVQLNDSFKLVEGAAVTNGTLTLADLWGNVQVDGLNGLLGELVMDKGVIGFEVRNVLTVVEANTSALAGVQQGAAAMVNQLTDKVAENLTLALRPAAEGKYDKQVWASYINSKETVDDRDFWDLKGSNTAKYRGAIVGADFYTSDKVIAGMAISYAKGDISANTIDSTHVQNDSKYYGVSFYDRVTNGPVALTYDIGYQYGKNDISMTARDHITSDVDTQSYTAGVRAERAYKVSKTSTFAPFVSLRYLRLHTKEYKNSNQAKFDANDQNLFIPKLGVAWHGDFVNAKSGWSFKPVAEIGYIFNIGNRSAETKYVTATSRAFNTEYDVVDSGTYYGKLGFRVAKKNFFIGADYNYQKGSTTKNSRWNVNLGWNF